MTHNIRIGCAGWDIPRALADAFGPGDSRLQRYATRLNAVEINTSFYKSHRRKAYAGWAAAVGLDFRFGVRMSQQATHVGRLNDLQAIGYFLDDVIGLGQKMGPILVQLPPSLAFAEAQAERFFAHLRLQYRDDLVCEPRHPTWFGDAADQVLARQRVARVAVDPAPVPKAALPGGWQDLAYYRLHGSPHLYHSAYSAEFLATLAQTLQATAATARVWCIFDNIVSGAGVANALALQELLPRP